MIELRNDRRQNIRKRIANAISTASAFLNSVPVRFTLLRLLIVLALLLLGGQLWRLQVAQGEAYREKADLNRLRVVSIRAPRGVIYDREQRILVRNVPAFTVSILPADLPSQSGSKESGNQGITREQVLQRLASILNMPVNEIRTQVDQVQAEIDKGQASPFVPIVIQSNVVRETAFILEEEHLDLPGVQVEIEPIRQYVNGPLFSQIIGYTGRISPEEYAANKGTYSLNDKVGKTGVELTFESVLRGVKGRKQIEVDAAGREVRTFYPVVEPQSGNNLVLTLDMDLQLQVTKALSEGMQAAGAVAGAAIAMNPQTGEILSLVSLPSYDNGLFSAEITKADYDRLLADKNRPLFDRAIGGAYPPGSTVKVIDAAAALQEGVVSRSTRLDCTGQMIIPDEYDPFTKFVFPCWLKEGHGWENIIDALAHSCDIFFYQVTGGFEDFTGLGIDRWARYARDFGLGQETGIDLPGESAALVPNSAWKLSQVWNTRGEPWLTGDTYNVAIGQGFLLATPLQILNAVAAIANGGTLYRPQIVYQVTDADGKVVQPFTKQVIRQVNVSKDNLALVREGMREAVTRGTATLTNYPQVAVAGKTGTAEYQGQKDAEGHWPTHAWFVCFAPADNPQIALIVFVEGGGNGAAVAVPIAAQILGYYFQLPPLEVPK
jgi:penicillin-binding protein 2